MRLRTLVCVLAGLAMLCGSTTAVAQDGPTLPVASWGERPVTTIRDLHSVHFHDAELGWVGAADGIVYKTADGGRSYQARPTGLFHPITIMDWVDEQHGWAGTADLGIAATSDGGDTWEVVSAGDFIGDFMDLTFLDAERGYASGQTAIFWSYLVRTSDGGRTWEDLPLHYPSQENEFRRVEVSSDEQTVWVLTWLWSDGDGISISRDGGETWSFVPIPADRLADMAFATDEVGVVVGRRGEVFRTTDGGETWTRAVAPSGVTLLDVDFIDDSRGWAVGEAGTVLATVDGGLTWTPEVSGAPGTITDASFVSTGQGWAASAAGDVRYRSPSTGAEQVLDRIGPPSGDPSPPILVAGDDDFDSPLSGVRSGSGTAEDPYVIEGWDVVPVAGDGITLIGTTAHVVIRDNHIHDAVGEGSGIRLVDASNVTIESNTVERTTQGAVLTGGGPVAVRSNVLSDLDGDGIEATSTSGLAVEANTLSLVGSQAIELVATPGPRVEGNEAIGVRRSGLRFGSAAGQPATDAVVRGNRVQDAEDGLSAVGLDDGIVEGNTFGLSGRHGMMLQLARRTTVRDNEVFGSGRGEIVSGQGSEDNLIEANTVDVREDGIRLEQDARAVVRDNTIRGGAHEAIVAEGAAEPLIEGNTVDGAVMAVRLTQGTTDGIVRSNTTTTDIWGITVEGGSSGNLVENNLVHSSDTENVSSPIHFGLNVSGSSDNNVLRDNHVTAAWTGIEVWDSSRFTTVEGNRVRATFSDGIRVSQFATDTVVRDNIVEAAWRDGIAVRGRSDRTLVERNQVAQASRAALSVIASSDVVFRDNTVSDTPVGFSIEGSCSRDPDDCDAARNVVISNTFSEIEGTGVLVRKAEFGEGQAVDLVVTDNALSGTGTALDIWDAIGFTASGNNIDVFAAGLDAQRSGEVDVRHNWWGAADGPSGAGPGSGASISWGLSTSVLYDPWLTAPNPSAG